MHWLAHRSLYRHCRCCHRSSGIMVAQDGDVQEKELGQETTGFRGRGQVKQVEGVDKQCRHSDKASLMPNSRNISLEASAPTQGSVLTIYLQPRQELTIEQELAYSDTSSRRANQSWRISMRSPHQYQVTVDMAKEALTWVLGCHRISSLLGGRWKRRAG